MIENGSEFRMEKDGKNLPLRAPKNVPSFKIICNFVKLFFFNYIWGLMGYQNDKLGTLNGNLCLLFQFEIYLDAGLRADHFDTP